MKKLLLACLLLACFTPKTTGQTDSVKGSLYLEFSIPGINNMVFNAGDSLKFTTGIIGLAGKVKYFTKENCYLEMAAGAASGKFLPPDLDEGPYQSMYSIYLRLTRNHTSGIFFAGYGVHYSRNFLEDKYHGKPLPGIHQDRSITQAGIGLSLKGGLIIFKDVFIGVQYHPIFLNPENLSENNYGHLYSLEAGVHFKIFQKKAGEFE